VGDTFCHSGGTGARINLLLTTVLTYVYARIRLALQIEHDQGGEYQDGREALERLKSHLEKKTALSDTKNVSS